MMPHAVADPTPSYVVTTAVAFAGTILAALAAFIFATRSWRRAERRTAYAAFAHAYSTFGEAVEAVAAAFAHEPSHPDKTELVGAVRAALGPLLVAERDVALLGHEFSAHFAGRMALKARALGALAQSDPVELAEVQKGGDPTRAFLWKEIDVFIGQARADLGTDSVLGQLVLSGFSGVQSLRERRNRRPR